ncbi:MAG: hypothetical protein IBX64_07920 [Actinobacteria bacterium]|nr:hypothetical protein [Actinomycetota bacterium]
MQIKALEERKAKFEKLLNEDGLNMLNEPLDEPPTLRMVKEQLGEHIANIRPELLEQEKKLYAVLDGFNWGNAYQDSIKKAAQKFAAHPDQFQQLVAIEERIAALAGAPEDSAVIEQLAQEFARTFKDIPWLADIREQQPEPNNPVERVMEEMLLSSLSPAHEKFFALLRDYLEDSEPSDR